MGNFGTNEYLIEGEIYIFFNFKISWGRKGVRKREREKSVDRVQENKKKTIFLVKTKSNLKFNHFFCD